MRRRISSTRFPETETVADPSQGVQLAFMQALARYWATDYDWRKCEAQLNAHPQFIIEIDGLDIHFLYRNVPTQIMMAAHPQTLYGLADSPVALAAWMIDHDVASYGHIVKLFLDGEPYGDLTRDDILDNITLAWLTNTGVSSARLYKEYKGAFFNDFTSAVPAAVSVFPEEVYQAPRSWSERAHQNLVHFNAVDKGGHFAAWEQPQLFSEEVRAGFRSLRG